MHEHVFLLPETMSSTTYADIFKTATKQESPYDYQCRLACGPEANLKDDSTIRAGTDCKSQLIKIPTGCGKTAAVVLAWLWNLWLFCSTISATRFQTFQAWLECLPRRIDWAAGRIFDRRQYEQMHESFFNEAVPAARIHINVNFQLCQSVL